MPWQHSEAFAHASPVDLQVAIVWHLCAVQRCVEEHARQLVPPAPHAVLSVPSAHLPLLSQQPTQFAGPQGVDGLAHLPEIQANDWQQSAVDAHASPASLQIGGGEDGDPHPTRNSATINSCAFILPPRMD